MQIGRKMTELEAFEVLSVILEHPVYDVNKMSGNQLFISFFLWYPQNGAPVLNKLFDFAFDIVSL